MSTEHSHRLSTSSASCISSTMSINDIQILSTSPALFTSTSSNTNNSSSSSSNSLSYSSERICYLLKHEKHKYNIVGNKASSNVASQWSFFDFQPSSTKRPVILKKSWDLQAVLNVKRLLSKVEIVELLISSNIHVLSTVI
jgi:hypothetical protein